MNKNFQMGVGLFSILISVYLYYQIRQMQTRDIVLQETVAELEQKLVALETVSSRDAGLSKEKICTLLDGRVSGGKCNLSYASLYDLNALKIATDKIRNSPATVTAPIAPPAVASAPKAKPTEVVVGRGTEVRREKHKTTTCVGAGGEAKCVEGDPSKRKDPSKISTYLKCLKGKKVLSSKSLTANKNQRYRFKCVVENESRSI